MYYQKNIQAASCGHTHCVKLRFYNDGTNALLSNWNKLLLSMKGLSPFEAQAAAQAYITDVLLPTLSRIPAFDQFVEKFGGNNIIPMMGEPEGNGEMVVHLTFPKRKLMDKFVKMYGGFGTRGATIN